MHMYYHLYNLYELFKYIAMLYVNDINKIYILFIYKNIYLYIIYIFYYIKLKRYKRFVYISINLTSLTVMHNNSITGIDCLFVYLFRLSSWIEITKLETLCSVDLNFIY